MISGGVEQTPDESGYRTSGRRRLHFSDKCAIGALGFIEKYCLYVGMKLARPERLELPTLWFEARCSIQLSYGRAKPLYLSTGLSQTVHTCQHAWPWEGGDEGWHLLRFARYPVRWRQSVNSRRYEGNDGYTT